MELVLTPLLIGMLAAPVGAQEPVDFTHLPALQSPAVTDSLMLDVTRAGDRLVAVGERGFVVYSDDGGSSWTQAEVPLSVNLTSVEFIDERNGFAAGHEGMLLASGDGGETWSRRFDGRQATQQEIALAEERITRAREALTAAGDDPDSEAAFLLEDAQWALEDFQTALEEGPSNPFLDVWFDGSGNGLAVGAYGYLYRSADGGDTWTLASRNIENPDKYHYYSIDETSDGTLYLVGEAGLLYRSSDRSNSWSRLNAPYEGSFFGVLTGTADDGEFVLVYGLRGNVFRSTDGGEQWQRIDAGTEASLMADTTMPDGRIVLVGNSGAILVSEDAGRSFSLSYRDDRLSLSGVAAADASHIVVAGAGGLNRVPVP
jgi:photosystem II stability/assembly factor-like uncharacterized protein